MALRKFNGKQYQIAKHTRREEICSKPIVEPTVEIKTVKTVKEVPVVKPAPKKRAKKSTK